MNKDITNEQLFEFMTKMYGEMQEGFGQLNSRMDNMEGEIKKTNAKIDHEVIPEGKRYQVSPNFCRSLAS